MLCILVFSKGSDFKQIQTAPALKSLACRLCAITSRKNPKPTEKREVRKTRAVLGVLTVFTTELYMVYNWESFKGMVKTVYILFH